MVTTVRPGADRTAPRRFACSMIVQRFTDWPSLCSHYLGLTLGRLTTAETVRCCGERFRDLNMSWAPSGYSSIQKLAPAKTHSPSSHSPESWAVDPLSEHWPEA